MSGKIFTSLLVVYALAALLALAASSTSVMVLGQPLFVLCVGLIFVLQWLAFVPAWLKHTERFYDLMGGLTYLSVLVLIVSVLDYSSDRTLLLAVLVAVWAVRLSGFLFVRVIRDGFDRRFSKIKHRFWRFFLTWNLQALWITFTGAAAFAAMSADLALLPAHASEIDAWARLGTLVWLFGFFYEVLADEQKRRFRAVPENRERFIQSGLWARCRHPNYFGEIVLWLGVAIVAAPVLTGWSNAALISPLFVYLLLNKVSGIPLLAASSKARWGDEEAYQEYLKNTPLLFPRAFKAKKDSVT